MPVSYVHTIHIRKVGHILNRYQKINGFKKRSNKQNSWVKKFFLLPIDNGNLFQEQNNKLTFSKFYKITLLWFCSRSRQDRNTQQTLTETITARCVCHMRVFEYKKIVAAAERKRINNRRNKKLGF